MLRNRIFIRNFARRQRIKRHQGGLAQLARALAWHARGHRFEPDILHRVEDGWFNCPSFFVLVNMGL